MAHVAKFSRGAMGHMLSHYDRSKDGLGDNIDPQRTHLNYNLAQVNQPKKQLDYIHDRLKEVKLQNRKDVNVLCDWVVTAPKDLPEQELEPFFKACYAFLTGKYGTKNVVSAYVHMDETTPHIHFAFIPVVPDKKHPGQEKVSAKEAITRKDLQVFHEELQKYVERALGHEVGILNEATKAGNKSIAELKRGSAEQQLAEVASEASRIVSEAQEKVNAAQDSLKAIEAVYGARKAYIETCEKEIQSSGMYPEWAEVDKVRMSLFGKPVEVVTVPKEKWESAYKAVAAQKSYEAERDEFYRTVGWFLHSATGQGLVETCQQRNQLQEQVWALQKENSELKEENNSLNIQVKYYGKAFKGESDRVIGKVNKVLDRLPAEMQRRFEEEWERVGRQERDRGYER